MPKHLRGISVYAKLKPPYDLIARGSLLKHIWDLAQCISWEILPLLRTRHTGLEIRPVSNERERKPMTMLRPSLDGTGKTVWNIRYDGKGDGEWLVSTEMEAWRFKMEMIKALELFRDSYQSRRVFTLHHTTRHKVLGHAHAYGKVQEQSGNI